jgi:PAS domain S-box-containing protein
MSSESFQNLTVLCVEDDALSREMLEFFLQQQSFKAVYSAKNGEEGLIQYFLHKPDMVLTDLNMPLMNGLELSAKIKENNPNVPILLITAQIEKEITEQAVDIGIDGYLFKPISLERLQLILEKYAQRLFLNKSLKNKHKLLEEYKAAIDASSAITKTDKQGVITYANESFCQMSGYSYEDLLGKNHSIIKHPNTPRSLYADMWKTIKSKNVWKGRLQNLKKDGTTYYEYAVIVPITNENDEIEEYISFKQDITDLYNQEQHLRNRIKEEVLKNLELHKNREEANLLEAKFSTIGKMAAGITHEINTPLTYIRGNLELIKDDINHLDDTLSIKPSLQEDLATVLDGVNRIATIVESMREMSSGTDEAPMYHNIYSSLVTSLILCHNKAKHITKIRLQNQIFEPQMDKKKLNYSTMVQRQRIEQVFIIIINNALDALLHLPDFNARLLDISISSEKEFLIIRFQDNGGGIDANILKKIFDPFESTKKEGGMGIGLNVAKRIIDSHGGKIIPSNHEEGALFEVWLPRINA